MNDIAPNDTTIMQDVLISWASKERVLSLKQTIQAEEQVRREAAKAEAENRKLKPCLIVLSLNLKPQNLKPLA